MISFFPLEAWGELHKEHLPLETQSHAKLTAPWVSQMGVCSTKSSGRIFTAPTPWKHSHHSSCCSWHSFFLETIQGTQGLLSYQPTGGEVRITAFGEGTFLPLQEIKGVHSKKSWALLLQRKSWEPSAAKASSGNRLEVGKRLLETKVKRCSDIKFD